MSNNTAQSLAKDETGFRSVVGKAVMDARGALMGVGWFSAFINILMLTGPLYMLQVYDRVLISASVPTLVSLSVLMVAMFAFMGFLEFCRSRVLLRVADKVERDLGGRTFDAWMNHGIAGKSAARIAPLNDVSTLKQFLSGNAPGTFFDIPWVVIYIFVIFLLHWMLGVFAVIGTLIILVVAVYNEVSTRKPSVEAMKFRRAEQSFALQSHRNTDAITAMGMGANMRSRWQDINQQGAVDAQRAGDRAANASSLTKALRMMVQSGILGLGGYLAVKQVVTPGTMIAGSIILGRALAPVQMSIGQWRSFNAAREAYARLNAFYKMVPDNTDSLSLPEPKGQLDVEHVFAGPPGATQAVLSDLNFSLQPGDGLGVIGPSAAGKSTLARLLVGLWSPQKGAIRLDRASFEQWNRAELGPYIGYVPQEVELFDGTIAENISRFTANATPEAIVEAAQMADVHSMILGLENGYDTRIGEGGAVLSGGQTQRIALARALYGKPKLLVLDEPNSNLDSDGDAALSRAIKLLRKQGSTVIVMAHRPSAISAVDKLLMLKDGRQVAFGPKDEVLKSVTKSVPQTTKPRPAPPAKIPSTSTTGGPAMQIRKPGAPS
ncbi:type I secretion system permease/ATPase [Fretibacter rubidus]|uniref:type I secretion system permease/ATPase n=1 Tax=Fretibacter rubidus TaxID=570162 RepID=UPI00352A17F6